MIKKIEKQFMMMQASNKNAPKNENEARSRNYQFWSTQPVPSFTENTEVFIFSLATF